MAAPKYPRVRQAAVWFPSPVLWASGLAHRETVAVLPGYGFFIVCAPDLVDELEGWVALRRAPLAAGLTSGSRHVTAASAEAERPGRSTE